MSSKAQLFICSLFSFHPAKKLNRKVGKNKRIQGRAGKCVYIYIPLTRPTVGDNEKDKCIVFANYNRPCLLYSVLLHNIELMEIMNWKRPEIANRMHYTKLTHTHTYTNTHTFAHLGSNVACWYHAGPPVILLCLCLQREW